MTCLWPDYAVAEIVEKLLGWKLSQFKCGNYLTSINFEVLFVTLEVYAWAKYLLGAVLIMEDAIRIDFWCLFPYADLWQLAKEFYQNVHSRDSVTINLIPTLYSHLLFIYT